MFGSLVGFLNKIRIDDTLRLVPEMWCLASVDQEDLNLEPNPRYGDHQDPMVEDIEEAVRDFSGFLSPVIGTATTPSDLPEDARMEEPTHSDADVDMAPPPPLHDPPPPPPPSTSSLRPKADLTRATPPPSTPSEHPVEQPARGQRIWGCNRSPSLRTWQPS